MALSTIAQDLRLKDNEKFLACMFAPEDLRDKIMAIFLFHNEIYDIPQIVSEPMVGKIKLQWWRDVISEIKDKKPARPHPILQALKNEAAFIDNAEKILDVYEDIIDGKQAKTLKEIEGFLDQGLGNTFIICSKILGEEYNRSLMLSYGYMFMANRLLINSGYAQKFATDPQKLIDVLLTEAEKQAPQNKAAFYVISKHGCANLRKQKPSDNNKWKLILKLLFKKLEIL